jgi:hypothetical protein
VCFEDFPCGFLLSAANRRSEKALGLRRRAA